MALPQLTGHQDGVCLPQRKVQACPSFSEARALRWGPLIENSTKQRILNKRVLEQFMERPTVLSNQNFLKITLSKPHLVGWRSLEKSETGTEIPTGILYHVYFHVLVHFVGIYKNQFIFCKTNIFFAGNWSQKQTFLQKQTFPQLISELHRTVNGVMSPSVHIAITHTALAERLQGLLQAPEILKTTQCLLSLYMFLLYYCTYYKVFRDENIKNEVENDYPKYHHPNKNNFFTLFYSVKMYETQNSAF